MTKLAVVGSRNFPDLRLVDSYLDNMRFMGENEPECIVSGGARGVDHRAEKWAFDHDIPIVSFRPERGDASAPWLIYRWSTSGQGLNGYALPGIYPSFAAAAFVRNGFIVEFADQTVAFWDGKSTGTHDSIRKARELERLRDIIHG